MVAAEMLQREVDDLILGLAADDLAALACDLPGHGLVSRAIVGSRPFAYVGGKVGARLERADNTYVQLCGRFVVEFHGRRIEQRFPSRQGRVLFAYLVLQRPRAVGRHFRAIDRLELCKPIARGPGSVAGDGHDASLQGA